MELATDSRALKYGGEFPARAIHAFPAATTTDAGALAKARASLTLGVGLATRARQAQAHEASRGGRLRRLSDRAAAHRRLASAHSERASRAERGDGPGQPFFERPRQSHRLRFFRLERRRWENRGQDPRDRQSRAAGRHRRRRHGLSRTGRTAPQRAGDRRLAGRADHGRRGSRGAGAHEPGRAAVDPPYPAGARRRQGARGGSLRADELSGRDRRILRRSAGADRRARISSSAGQGRRPSPNLR